MKFKNSTDVSKFDPEQQDALLAEMQAESINLLQHASDTTVRESAKAAFAAMSRARARLIEPIEIVQNTRADEEASALKPKQFPRSREEKEKHLIDFFLNKKGLGN